MAIQVPGAVPWAFKQVWADVYVRVRDSTGDDARADREAWDAVHLRQEEERREREASSRPTLIRQAKPARHQGRHSLGRRARAGESGARRNKALLEVLALDTGFPKPFPSSRKRGTAGS